MTILTPLRHAATTLFRMTTIGLDKGPHMVRYRMYYDIRRALEGCPQPRAGARVLSISRSTYLCGLLPGSQAQITEADFPEHNILDLRFPDDTFDFLVCDQVLEHVRGNPQQAVDESRRVLRPGGVAVHTTCVLNELHGLPNDYWRFTPNGLAYLFRDYSRILEVGSWGNRLAFFGFRYLQVPNASWHPIHKLAMLNQPTVPISTWIVAQK